MKQETKYKALKKREILIYIKTYRREHRISPTLVEIGEGVNVSQGSLSNYYMEELIEDGWLRHTPGKARSLVPARAAKKYPIPDEADNVGA